MKRGILLSIMIVATLQTPAAFLTDAQASPSLEYLVKGAYITKFISFITWPSAAFPRAKEPVTICVLGDDPFDGALNQAAAAIPGGEQPITVRHIPEPDTACQIVFVHLNQDQGLKVALATLSNRPVVTVTDSDMSERGIIHFVFDQGHVRFEIDQTAASRVGLVISSKLLSLAQAVR
jgi:hypothetical protein